MFLLTTMSLVSFLIDDVMAKFLLYMLFVVLTSYYVGDNKILQFRILLSSDK